MNRKSVVTGLVFGCVIILGIGKVDARKIPSGGSNATLLVTGMGSLRVLRRCRTPARS